MKPFAALLILLFSPCGATAQFYAGKTITLISGASGGYDTFGRVLAQHMGKHIEGHPHIVVRNMPGAASMVAANYLYNVAPPDGLTFGVFVRSIATAPLFGDKAAKYAPEKFTWIGTSSTYLDDAYSLMVRKDRGVNTLDDLRSRPPLRLGSTGPSAEGDIGSRVIADVLGIEFKMVRGYQGTPNVAMAVEQGEMDGMMLGLTSIQTFRAEWLKPDSPVRFLVQFGYGGAGRHPAIADVPRIDEFARTDEARAIFKLMQMGYRIARPFAAPPGVPADRAKILRDAFMATHKDPAYLEDARKAGLDISPANGEEVARVVSEAVQLPPALVKRYADILAKGE